MQFKKRKRTIEYDRIGACDTGDINSSIAMNQVYEIGKAI